MIVDGGARGHALALAYLNSGFEEAVVAPGNYGMINNMINPNNLRNIVIDQTVNLKKPETILDVVLRLKPDFVDVAQDDALAAGTVNLLQQYKIPVFGPTRLASQIEWDKEWSRDFQERHNIDHPEYHVFNRDDGIEIAKAEEITRLMLDKYGIVFWKAAGLLGGKGVISVKSMDEIDESIKKMKEMGNAARRFLVEEGMIGEEFSYYVIVNEGNYQISESAQDNKRIWNRDKGPNTGGMGSHTPALVTKGLEKRIETEIILPTILGLAEEGRPYTGILYIGGMYDKTTGKIRVVEFNSRWGDPEGQVILAGIKNYSQVVQDQERIKSDGLVRVNTVGATSLYPGNVDPIKGKRFFINYSMVPEGVHFLSAGIKTDGDGKMYANGGRLVNSIGLGKDVLEARTRSLQGIVCCDVEGNNITYRTDTAWRDVERLRRKIGKLN